MKVRVPKELRPPAIEFVETEEGNTHGMQFRCVRFRKPRRGEFYYFPRGCRFFASDKGIALMAAGSDYSSPYVILERVPGSLEPRRGA